MLVDRPPRVPVVAVVVPESGTTLLGAIVGPRLVIITVVRAELLAAEITEVIVRRHAVVEAELNFVVVILRFHNHLVVACFIYLQSTSLGPDFQKIIRFIT